MFGMDYDDVQFICSLARSQQRVRASRPTRGSQTESSESETETESESDSESYKEDNQPAAVNTVTVAPRKRGDNGRQGAGKEVEKRGQSRVKVPAGSVRVLPDSGRTWDKGDEEQQEEKARGGGMDGEDSSWDRYVNPLMGNKFPKQFSLYAICPSKMPYSRHKYFFSLCICVTNFFLFSLFK